VAENHKTWETLLKRPFHTLKADGPFIFERAEVDARVTDELASLGDPPTLLRLSLVRFRLEGINTGWKVIAARRVLQDEPASEGTPESSVGSTRNESSPSKVDRERRSLGDQLIPEPER
jgi:hypothetical protein